MHPVACASAAYPPKTLPPTKWWPYAGVLILTVALTITVTVVTEHVSPPFDVISQPPPNRLQPPPLELSSFLEPVQLSPLLEPVHIVMSWCLGGDGSGPAVVSLKSIILSDMQHGNWDSPAAPL